MRRRKNRKPKLTFLVGLTCVGKSYKVDELLKKMPEAIVLSTDSIVEDLADEEGITYDEFFATMGSRDPNRFVAQVLPVLHATIDHATLNGLDVIVDMQNINKRARALTYGNPKFEDYELHAIVFDDDHLSSHDRLYLEKVKRACFMRSQSEPKTVPEHVIERSFEGYEVPTKKEGFKTIKKVKGSNPILHLPLVAVGMQNPRRRRRY